MFSKDYMRKKVFIAIRETHELLEKAEKKLAETMVVINQDLEKGLTPEQTGWDEWLQKDKSEVELLENHLKRLFKNVSEIENGTYKFL